MVCYLHKLISVIHTYFCPVVHGASVYGQCWNLTVHLDEPRIQVSIVTFRFF